MAPAGGRRPVERGGGFQQKRVAGTEDSEITSMLEVLNRLEEALIRFMEKTTSTSRPFGRVAQPCSCAQRQSSVNKLRTAVSLKNAVELLR